MSVLKIVIADTSRDFCESLTGYIRFRKGLEILGASGDGEKAVQLIQKKTPNLLVMNPMIENSMALLSYIHKSGVSLNSLTFPPVKGRFIVPLSPEWSSPPGEMASQVVNLSEYIRNILEPVSTAEYDAALEVQISNLMRQLGIPAHLKGYQYLRKAIIMAMKDPAVMDGVTKILYPDIAKCYGTTASCVERAMRKAIAVAWERGNIDFLQYYFGCTKKPQMAKPTNSEFIATVADILYLRQDHAELLACV